MPSTFKFMLHPKHWVYDGDDTQVFNAYELADGTYLVTWVSKGIQAEMVFPSTEVFEAIAEKHWLVIEQ